MLSTVLSPIRRLWRLSALRQALLLTVAFLIVIAGAAGYAVYEVRDAMDRSFDDRLQARFADVSAALSDGTFSVVSDNASSLERVIFIPDSQSSAEGYGERGIFFDDELVPPEGRFRGVPREPWIFYGGPVQNGWLIIGRNVGELSVFDEVLADTFIGIGWVTLAISLSLGLLLGWRTQRRLTDVTRVLGRAADGDLTARVAPRTNRDDLDQLGVQVDETIVRIGAALQQARGFSANIAHDLKTPLTRLRIRLETALLAQGDREDEVGAALEQCDKAIAIFDAFLRLSKLESGALEQAFAPVDLMGLAGTNAETYAAVAEDSGRTLRTDLSPVVLSGDKVLLNQFLINLLQNALRHTPEGSTLTIIAAPGIFGVLDDGPGIPVAQRAAVTEPLYRLDRSRTTEGAGLGLALAKSIAARHGAELVLSDPPAGGAGLFARMVWTEPATKKAKLTKL
jgi:signal transduction histidine kinase